MSVDTKKLVKNAYRVTKERYLTALRVRVPGGHLDTKQMTLISRIADRYGRGEVHITTRQGFEIPGIPMSRMEEVNREITPLLDALQKTTGIDLKVTFEGYPAAGTRNVSACIGNRVCPFANYDTTRLAQDIEGIIYPNDFHVKIAVSGCPNDCIKAHMQDVGILGQVEPLYDSKRCIGCKACVDNCRKRVTGALKFHDFTVQRDHEKCTGCGECILKCPTAAWTRGEKYYSVVIMGRTGKKNPRLAAPFLRWVARDVVLKICENLYSYIDKHIDRSLPKEHVGYIVDRTGYPVFRDEVLQNVDLGERAMVAKHINFGGYEYHSNASFERV